MLHEKQVRSNAFGGCWGVGVVGPQQVFESIYFLFKNSPFFGLRTPILPMKLKHPQNKKTALFPKQIIYNFRLKNEGIRLKGKER